MAVRKEKGTRSVSGNEKDIGLERGTDVVVVLGNRVRQAHLDCANDGNNERAQLQISELYG